MAQFVRGSVKKFFGVSLALTGNWGFDEGSGIVAKSLVGNAHLNLFNGPQWTAGKIGSALSFDGVDDYAAVAGGPGPLNVVTVMAWVKTPANIANLNNYNQIVFRGQTATTGYSLYFDHNYQKFSFILLTTSGNWGSDWAIGTTTPSPNTWYFLVGMRDNNGFVSIWVNGVRENIDTTVTSGTINYGASPAFFLGSKPGGYYWKGLIDEVAIFSRALSPREIQSYYNWAIGKSTPIIYTPRKNAAVLNVGEVVPSTIKARRGLIMSM
jgi:hypothetical protein